MPDLNPAGVEASMRLQSGTLNHLPRETFVVEAKHASDREGQSPGILRKIAESMPLDSAQLHQIEQDAITAEWEAHRLAACDAAIALLREIADLEKNDDGDVILGADTNGHNDLMSRTSSFLAIHDQLGNAP